jgi:hypothetical protein
VVEVASRRVKPPVEERTRAVVVAPTDGTATTWRRLKFESEEVAEMVRTEKGEVVPKPVLETPAA